MNAWDNIDEKELKRRKRNAKKLWNSLSDDEKQHRLNLAIGRSEPVVKLDQN